MNILNFNLSNQSIISNSHSQLSAPIENKVGKVKRRALKELERNISNVEGGHKVIKLSSKTSSPQKIQVPNTETQVLNIDDNLTHNEEEENRNPDMQMSIPPLSPDHLEPSSFSTSTSSASLGDEASLSPDIFAESNALVDRMKLLNPGQKDFNTPFLRKAVAKAHFVSTDREGIACLTFEGVGFVVERKDHKLNKFYTVSNLNDEILGVGLAGQVRAVMDVVLGKKIAIKKANIPEPGATSQNGEILTPQQQEKKRLHLSSLVKRDVEILNELNRSGPQEGVLSKPHFFFERGSEVWYSMDLGIPLQKVKSGDPLLAKTNFCSLCINLVAGIRYFLQASFVHTDIKIGNILFFEENGKVVAKHADIGGGFFFRELKEGKVSVNYTYFPDAERKKLLSMRGDKFDEPAIRKISENQMVYSLGMTLKKFLNYHEIQGPLLDIVNKMANPDFSQLPSIEHAYLELTIHSFLN